MTRPAFPQRRADAGLTLVEVLIVLSIIAIAAGAAMLRLGLGQGEAGLTASATSLAVAITAASDRALVEGQDLRLDIGPEGYRVAPVGAEVPWQALIRARFTDPTSATYLLPADGTAAPFALRLQADEASALVRFDGLSAVVEAAP